MTITLGSLWPTIPAGWGGRGKHARNPGASRFGWLLFLAVLIGLTTSLTTPFIPVFVTRSLHATPTELGMFLFVTAAAAVVTNAVVGLLTDRGRSQRRLLLAASLAGLAAALIFAVSRSYPLLLVVAGTLTPCGASLVPQIFATARRRLEATGGSSTRARLAALRAQFSVAWVIGPVAGAAILSAWGFRGLFAAAGLTFAAVFAMCLSLTDVPAPPSARAASGTGVRPWRMLSMSGAFLAMQTASSIGVLALPLLITSDLRASTTTVGVTVGLAAILEIPLMLALGRVSKRFSPLTLLCAGAAAGSAYYAIVAAATQIWQVVTVQILSALFVSTVMGLGISLFQDIGAEHSASATAWYINIIRISSMIAGPIVGYGQWLGTRVVFLAASLLCALGLVSLGLMMRTARGRGTHESHLHALEQGRRRFDPRHRRGDTAPSELCRR